MPARPRDPRIDLMRVVALVYILLHHADDYGIEFLRLTPEMALLDDVLTYIALATFFALSGFLAARPAAEKASARTAALRRFRRLYPPFAIAMLLFWFAGLYKLDWQTTLINIALLGPWIGDATPTLWFVEILLVFQLAYASRLSFQGLRMRPWTIPPLIGAIVAVGGTISWALGFSPDPRLVLYLPTFAGGAMCGEVLRCTDERTTQTRGLLVGSAVTAGAAVLLSVMPIWRDLPVIGLVISLLTTFAVCTVVATPLRAPQRPENPSSAAARLVMLIAYGSYMAYLAHRLVFEYAARLAEPFGAGWVTFAVLACIPLVLAIGVWLQRGYDAGERGAFGPTT